MAMPKPTFIGNVPAMRGYNSRIRIEVINYRPEAGPDVAAVASRTGVYYCNACQHVWSETVPGDAAG